MDNLMDDLMIECKKGLGIPQSSEHFDTVLGQKVLMVKSYMLGAGVSDTLSEDPLYVGTVVLGVTDLWKLDGGEIRFSPVFQTLVTQLAMRS